MANTKLEELNLVDKFLFDEAMEDRETYQATLKADNSDGKPQI